ncbi:hypothetical protein PSACC_02372 [Paramicrosporidium saccamoebae]|uniref:Uncharacterized protein n=1 Tax=Paramicrosporidium saccamoebae TaxID=1246581 RepID=A0A2H9TJA6_9FUNG|nr:hypothetical protein PSACC_02372 [Paramicrosporidium saccamoebae]
MRLGVPARVSPITVSMDASIQDDAPVVNLTEEIAAFIKDKGELIGRQNQEEFIETVEDSGLPARLNTRLINKESHIRSSVVDNQDGPLSRSVISSTCGKLVSPHGIVVSHDISDRPVFNGLEERVRNIETHLGIVVAPLDRSLVERVKVLEDKILKIEMFYPQIASRVFNYGRAEAEASARPGGRVSKLPGTTSNAASKKRVKEDAVQEVEEDSDAVDDSSLGELKRRMSELRSRLLKQTK